MPDNEDKKDKRVKISIVEEGIEVPIETKREEVKEKEDETPVVEVKEDKKEPEDLPKNEDSQPVELSIEKYKEEKEKIPFGILFIAFLLGLALGAGLIGGVFYYKTNMKDSPESTPTPTATLNPDNSSMPQDSPSPSPAAKLDLSKFTVLVQNGSGIPGEAGKVEKLLQDKGFEKTTTQNAKSYNYTTTEVYIKKNIEDGIYKEIESTLSTYELSEKEALPTQKEDVVVIVGKTKK